MDLLGGTEWLRIAVGYLEGLCMELGPLFTQKHYSRVKMSLTRYLELINAGIKEDGSQWVDCIFLIGFYFFVMLHLTVLLICLLLVFCDQQDIFSFAVYTQRRSKNVRAKEKPIHLLHK